MLLIVSKIIKPNHFDDYESLIDMIVIDGLLKSSKKGGIKVKIKKVKK